MARRGGGPARERGGGAKPLVAGCRASPRSSRAAKRGRSAAGPSAAGVGPRRLCRRGGGAAPERQGPRSVNPRIVLAVACDLLREARARRWVLGLFAATTLVLLAILVGLRLEVVDGALAATRLFGGLLGGGTIQAADVAL